MRIETADKTYLVIGYLGRSGVRELYLCETGKNSRRFLIIRLNDRLLAARTMEFLYAQAESQTFTDLAECFVFQEQLHLVFPYRQGISLEEKLSGEHAGLRERLEIGKKLTEKMVLLSMPFYFQRRCLGPGAIYVTGSSEVSFAYDLEDLERYGSYTMGDVQEGLARVMELLFQDELKKEVITPMEDFVEFLREETCGDYLEIYRRGLTVWEQILALSQEELEAPKTWIFRVWDRVRTLFRPMKRLAVIAILVFGLGCLIWTIGDAVKPAEPAVIMTRIGTEQV